MDRRAHPDRQVEALAAFRRALHGRAMTARRDALMDLLDAVIGHDGRLDCLPELALGSIFRRRHPSVYDALAHGQIERDVLESLLIEIAEAACDGPPVYALDESAYPRPSADTLAEREMVAISVGDRHLGRPGFWYSFLARLDTGAGAWAVPVSARRSAPGADRLAAAAAQVRDLVARLPASGRRPLVVADAGYPPGRLSALLAGVPVDLCIRVRSDRVLHRPAGPRPAGTMGRTRRWGVRIEMADPARLPAADETAASVDRHGRALRVSAWHGVTAKANGSSPEVTGSVLLVKVGEHMLPLRLFWIGAGRPSLIGIARAYLARFDIEHMFRFWKRDLGWRTPALGSPGALDTWTSLLVAVHAHLALARGLVTGIRLPWQRPAEPGRLSPGRVRRGFRAISAMLGTPAGVPKLVLAGSGWPPGRPRAPRQRHEAFSRSSAMAIAA